MQTKKLKNEEKAETLKLLASLSPSTSTSAALASTSTLGQKPMAPSTATERMDIREDRLVRNGISRLSRRDPRGPDGESDSEESGSQVEARGVSETGRASKVVDNSAKHKPKPRSVAHGNSVCFSRAVVY